MSPSPEKGRTTSWMRTVKGVEVAAAGGEVEVPEDVISNSNLAVIACNRNEGERTTVW